MSEKQIIQQSAQFAKCALSTALILTGFLTTNIAIAAKKQESKVVSKTQATTAKSTVNHFAADVSDAGTKSLDLALFEQARSLVTSHKFSQAEEILSKLAKQHTEEPRVHLLYGELLEQLGRLDEASKEYERVAELNSSDPIPTINLARISLKQLELELSLSYAQQAVARDPSYLPARIALIETLIACDQTGEAERQLRFISEKDKSKKSVQKVAYRLALKKGDFAGAHQYLTSINQSELAEKKQKGTEESAEQTIDSQAGSELNAGSISALEEIDLLETLGKYGEARQKLEAIIASDSESEIFEARLKLARLLESKFHDYDEALNNFNEALVIDPLSATAIAGQDRCRTKRRNLALQLKIMLREIWAQQQAAEHRAISSKKH
jgi:tetratricopeptide (TPR) repeat protein